MAVELAATAHDPRQFPRDRLPEVAFVGRSNVGKSSLLNTMLLRHRKRVRGAVRKKLAKTSQTPGRTRSINFFRINRKLYFVDLPGYGYARVRRTEQDRWKLLAEGYLVAREPLRLVVLLVDIRRGPTVLDRRMAEWLEFHEQPFCVAATKSDKLKQGARLRSARSIEESFAPPIPFSAVSGEGVKQLWRVIDSALAS